MGRMRAIVDGKAGGRTLALWLLLLSIFTHALVPAEAALDRARGSAFSAATDDVSLAPVRKAAGDDRVVLRARDRDSSEGAAPPGPAILAAAVSALPPPAVAHTPAIAPAASVVPGGGGAASFQARAPPSI